MPNINDTQHNIASSAIMLSVAFDLSLYCVSLC